MAIAIYIICAYLFVSIPFYVLRKIFDIIAEETEIRINDKIKNK